MWGMIALGMEALSGIADPRCTFPANVSFLLMVASDWHITGLNGRLNAILDGKNARHPCAGNIALNRDQLQSGPFDLSRPFEVEDAQDAKFEMPVKVLSGRTSFVE